MPNGIARTALTIVVAFLALACSALVAPEARAQPKVRLSPASGPAGMRVSLQGSGFAKRGRVVVKLRRKTLAKVRARKGGFTVKAKIPRRARGNLALVSRGRGGRVISVFRVRPSHDLAKGGEVALANGMRLRSEPSQGSPGALVRLEGSGFPKKKPVLVVLGGVASSAGSTSEHGAFSQLVPVPSLDAGTVQLSVRVGSKALASPFTIVVDPLFVAAGDIACDPESPLYNGGAGTNVSCHMRETSNLVLGLHPDVVAVLGDSQYEAGTPADFRTSYDPTWGRFKSITRPVIGDHEYGHQEGAGFFSYFGGLGGDKRTSWYSYDVGAWHVVAFNTNCGRPYVGCTAGTTQERWLRADLAAHPNRCVLAYTHKPLYTSAGEVDPRIRQLYSALYDAGVDLVLSGDKHHYERFAPQDVNGHGDPARGFRQFVVGTGGRDLQRFGPILPNSEVREWDTFGVLTLRLHATSYDWRFAPEPGHSFSDSGSATCH